MIIDIFSKRLNMMAFWHCLCLEITISLFQAVNHICRFEFSGLACNVIRAKKMFTLYKWRTSKFSKVFAWRESKSKNAHALKFLLH